MYKKNWWFILIISIFIVLSVVIVLLIWVNVITKNHLFIEEQITYDSFYNKAAGTVKVIAKYNKNNNSDWLWNDILVCSWWLISNTKNNWAICMWSWTAWTDSVDDACNNDDKTPYFVDKNIPLWDFFDNNSILNDNDADARINNIWFIYPWERKTVFYFDKNISNIIIWNKDNTYFALPEVWKNATMYVKIGWGAGMTWTLSIDTKNGNEENYYISSKKSIIDFNSSWVLWDNGSLGFSQPFLFDLNSEKEYIINIDNPTNNIINYTLVLRDNKNVPIYQVPINDNDNWINIPYYEWVVENNDLLMRKLNVYTKDRN